MRFYKRISLKLLFISIILVIIFPLLILGDFQQDDFYISSLNNLNFNSSLSSIFSQFSNRPLAAIFFSILSIFFYSYEHFFLLNIILILFSCNFIIKAFNEYFISRSSRVIFTVLCLVPIYSYSTIFSSGMQIVGNLSIFIWSISIYFLNKFIKTDKFTYLMASNIVLFSMFMTYESAFPLIILNLFLPFFKKNLIKLKHIFITVMLTLILSAIVQKLILPHLFNQDISRLRVDDLNLNSFILYMGANLLLLLNIFYIFFQNFNESLRIILNSNILLAQFLSSLGIFFLMVLINYKENLMIKLKDDNNFLIISLIICFFVLLAFMHTVAKSAINIYGINNRALVSLSFFIPLILILLSNMKSPKYFFIIILIYIFLIITNYIPIQYNNIIYVKERNTSFKKITQKINIDHGNGNNSFIYLDRFNNNSLFNHTTYAKDNFDFSNMTGFNHYNTQNDNSIWSANIRNSMFCNKAYWNLHFKKKIFDVIRLSKKIYFIEKSNNQYVLKEFNNYNLFKKFIEKKIICNSDLFYQDFINSKFNKISNKDFINNSNLIKKAIDIYISIN
jgi:hypothetical protein